MSRRGLRAQASIELVIALPILLAAVGTVLFLSFAGYQRAHIDHRLSTLGDLPAGWEAMAPDDLVKQMLLEDGVLEEDELDVEGASVEAVDDAGLERDDPVASGLGASISRTERRRIQVSADVSYSYARPMLIGDPVVYRRHVERRYVVYTDYEVS